MGEGVQAPWGLLLAALDLLGQGGRNSDAGSGSPLALTSFYLSTDHSLGWGQGRESQELGLQGKHTNGSERESGRNVGPTGPGDSGRDGSKGDKDPRSPGPQLCRYAGRGEREREREEGKRRTSEREEDATSHTESLQFPDATFSLVPRPLHKPCPTLWDERHGGAV